MSKHSAFLFLLEAEILVGSFDSGEGVMEGVEELSWSIGRTSPPSLITETLSISVMFSMSLPVSGDIASLPHLVRLLGCDAILPYCEGEILAMG